MLYKLACLIQLQDMSTYSCIPEAWTLLQFGNTTNAYLLSSTAQTNTVWSLLCVSDLNNNFLILAPFTSGAGHWHREWCYYYIFPLHSVQHNQHNIVLYGVFSMPMFFRAAKLFSAFIWRDTFQRLRLCIIVNYHFIHLKSLEHSLGILQAKIQISCDTTKAKTALYKGFFFFLLFYFHVQLHPNPHPKPHTEERLFPVSFTE